MCVENGTIRVRRTGDKYEEISVRFHRLILSLGLITSRMERIINMRVPSYLYRSKLRVVELLT